ncbi:MAG: transposase [Anaerolineae bacterium]|nr:transposase [Anaerolineae bacterium]
MKYDSETHHRRSVRYPGYDYRQMGAYFVTICAYQKEPIFGQVVEDTVQLSPIGEIADRLWRDIPLHKVNVQCPVWVVMPNHLHGIIVIENGEYKKDEALTAADRDSNAPSLRNAPAGSLGAVVGNFKSVSTRQVNRLRDTPGARVWQMSYYEHIIRNESDYNRIVHYIVTNPLRWDKDDYYV